MPVEAQGSRGDTAFAANAPIVAALARAQAELNNPEKSLTATISRSNWGSDFGPVQYLKADRR
jgi:hypothetical protein